MDRAARPLRSVTAGLGPPLLLLHGFGMSPLTYERVIDRLAGRYRVVAPWLRESDGPWTFDGAVACVEATLLAHTDEPAVVVGHSFGGALAIGLAATRPARVATLIPVNAFGISPGRARLARLGLNPRNVRTYGRWSTARDFVTYVAQRPQDLMRSALWAFSAQLEVAAAQVVDAAVPRACLWSADDSLLPLSVGERTAKALDAQLLVVAGRTEGERMEHDWPWRHPTYFAKQVAAATRVAAPVATAQP